MKYIFPLLIFILVLIGIYFQSFFYSSSIVDLKDEKIVKGVFFGDTHFASRGFAYFDRAGKKKPQEFFEIYGNLEKSIFSDLDFSILNFESALYSEENYCPKSGKSVTIKTHEKYLKYFRNAGFTIFDISNNHSYDCSKTGFDFLKEELGKNKIGYFGDGRKSEINEYFLEKNGHKIVFLGFNETTFYNDWDKKGARVENYKSLGYKVIVNIHWGKEYKTSNNSMQRKIAEKLIDYGADAIIGHHPHVVQNFEEINGVPVFYSLGNFMFDQPFPETLTGMGVYMEIGDRINYEVFYFERTLPYFEIKKLDFGY